jgi:hypothetical protein
MKKIILILLIVSTSYNLFSQSVIATVNSGSHLIKTTDWSKFSIANILVEKVDGSKRKIYMFSATRPINPGAMYVEGLQDDFEQGSSVKVYVLKPKISGITSNPIQATVNSGSHLIKTTDWSIYNNRTILVEEINGMNQNVYQYSGTRPINPGAMYVEGLQSDYEQGTDVYVYIIENTHEINSEITIGSGSVNANTTKIFLKNPSGKTWAISSGANQITESSFSIYNWSDNQNTPLLHLNSNGDFGIGTYTPGYKLDVLGTIRAREIKVDLNGADFVFEKDYKLMPLSELEKFVKEQKHLPEVAPAKYMEKNGTDLGNLNSKLLQKIEELTLYTIEQNKKLEQQNEKITTLENEIKEMKKK